MRKILRLALDILRDIWESKPPSPIEKREEKSKFIRRREKRLTYIRNKECYHCARGIPLVPSPISTEEILDSIINKVSGSLPTREHLETIGTSMVDELGCTVKSSYEVRHFCSADWMFGFGMRELLYLKYPDLRPGAYRG